MTHVHFTFSIRNSPKGETRLNFSNVLAWVLPPVAVGGLALFETRQVFEALPGVYTTTWRTWIPWMLTFAAWGCACFGVMLVAKAAGDLQLGGGQPSDLTLAVAAIAAAQGLRIEAFRRPDTYGRVRGPAERESLYAKGLRLLMSDMYKSYVKHQADGTPLRMLLARGLVASYMLDDMLQEFRGWAASQGNSQELIDWAAGVQKSKTQNNRDRVFALALRIVCDDAETGRHLASRRPSIIVSQRAF
jgi:hypothetical protein